AMMREHLAEREAALADALEFALAAHEGFVAFEEGETLTFKKTFGRRLAVELAELGLVVEQLQLARRAGHEEVDDVLDLRREVALSRGKWVGGVVFGGACFGRASGVGRPAPNGGRGRDAISHQEFVERDCAEAHAAL